MNYKIIQSDKTESNDLERVKPMDSSKIIKNYLINGNGQLNIILLDYYFNIPTRSIEIQASSQKEKGRRWKAVEAQRNKIVGVGQAMHGRVAMQGEFRPLYLLPQREAPPPESRMTSHRHLLRLAVA